MLLALTLLICSQVDDTPIQYRLEPTDKVVTTADDAVAVAYDNFNADGTRHPRYIHIPDWYDEKYAKAAVDFVLNSTISRTANLISTEQTAGRVLRINLQNYAVRDDDLREILTLWELFADRDSYFHIPRQTLAAVEFEIKLNDGKWGRAKLLKQGPKTCEVEFSGKSHTVPIENCRGFKTALIAPIDHLGELAIGTNSNAPIMRYDEFLAHAFSTINNGIYYELTGISGDLKTTVERFAGKDSANKLIKELSDARAGRLDPATSQSRALVITSNVTGRQRLVQVMFGSNGIPTIGPQIIAITLDIAEGNTNPESDPLRNLRDFRKYDGGEMIFTLPNGLLAYVVTDNQDKIIASVPDGVAHDYTARSVRPNAATVRVFSGTACMHCHDTPKTNWGWQPVRNDATLIAQKLGGPISDTTKDRQRALQELASQYAAKNLDSVFNLSRIPYQKQTTALTGLSSTSIIADAIADAHFGYWYDRVTPSVAARDLGAYLPEQEAQAMLLKIPPANGIDTLVEDAVLLRIKEGDHATPTQWRSVVSLIRHRAKLGAKQ